MTTPPTHIYHSMLLHEALTAVHSSYGYGLLAIHVYLIPRIPGCHNLVTTCVQGCYKVVLTMYHTIVLQDAYMHI